MRNNAFLHYYNIDTFSGKIPFNIMQDGVS